MCFQPQEINEEPKQEEKPQFLSNHVREGSQDGEDSSMNIIPMRPLLRGYCGNLTLPGHRAPAPRYHPQPQRPAADGNDYCDVAALANGYLSDGEILRNGPARTIEGYDGYASEDGTLYVRKLHSISQQLVNG